jgi:hypothetical protein
MIFVRTLRHAWDAWKALPKRTRNAITTVAKLLLTVAGFWLLLSHEVGTWNRDGRVAFAPIEGDVTTVTLAGEPVPRLPSKAAVEALPRGEQGFAVEGDLLYVAADKDASRVVVEGHPDLGRVRIATAISDYVGRVDPGPFVAWSLVATLVKLVGVVSSCYGWQLLLRGQGLRFPFWQQGFTAFLIGRFIGTFMPSTIGLDGYTLYEAGRYSNEWHRAITAKALEKFIGIAGLFTGLLLSLPAGYVVLVGVVGPRAGLLTALIGVISAAVTGTVVLGLVRPAWLRALLGVFGRAVPAVATRHVERFTDAVVAYEGNTGLLLGALLAKFVTHFTTAMVYFFTARAIGVIDVEFLPVVFGSLIQILGTLFSPTIAGEGAREALQALLLSHHLGGAAQAVLSAALGFVAAEAATLWGGAFWWVRRPGWRPSFVLVDGKQVDYAWIDDSDTGFDAEKLAQRT